jgi:Flp pilus assembly protein TadG
MTTHQPPAPRDSASTVKARSLWSDTSGVSAIEFAFIAPVLMLLIANIIDLSMYAFSRIQVDVAAQQGARTVLVACELDKLL